MKILKEEKVCDVREENVEGGGGEGRARRGVERGGRRESRIVGKTLTCMYVCPRQRVRSKVRKIAMLVLAG